jgi:hypothetical protein
LAVMQGSATKVSTVGESPKVGLSSLAVPALIKPFLRTVAHLWEQISAVNISRLIIQAGGPIISNSTGLKTLLKSHQTSSQKNGRQSFVRRAREVKLPSYCSSGFPRIPGRLCSGRPRPAASDLSQLTPVGSGPGMASARRHSSLHPGTGEVLPASRGPPTGRPGRRTQSPPCPSETGLPLTYARGRRAGAVHHRAMDGSTAAVLPARPPVGAGTHARRVDRLLMRAAPDLALRVRRCDVRPGAGRGMQSARRPGAGARLVAPIGMPLPSKLSFQSIGGALRTARQHLSRAARPGSNSPRLTQRSASDARYRPEPEGHQASEAVPVPVAAFQLGCSSSVRAWSIWSYAYATMAAVVIVSPLRASDS